MGDSKIKLWLKKYGLYILALVLTGLFTFLDIAGVDIHDVFLVILVITFILVGIYQKYQDEREKKGDKGIIKSLKKTQESLIKDTKNQNSLLKKHQQTITIMKNEVNNHNKNFSDWKERKETSIQLLNELIQQSVISESEAYNNFDNKYLFIIYCYAKALPKVPDFGKYGRKKRTYTKFFLDELKCLRINISSPIFITNSKRLPENLHNTFNLKEYSLSRLEHHFKDEWDIFISELKKEKKPEYSKYKNKNYKKFLEASLAVFRCNINDKNIGKIREFTFPDEFNELLNEEIDFDRFEIPKEKRAKVKEFMKSSSIELLFKGLEPRKVRKLISLEDDLREKFEITSLFDYLERKRGKIKNFFKSKGFSNKDANFYSDRMLKKLKLYKEALKELNIII